MKARVKVKPNKRELRCSYGEDGMLRVQLTSQPVDGKANEELISFLAEVFLLKRKDISISSGHTSKIKTVEIHCTESHFQKITSEMKWED